MTTDIHVASLGDEELWRSIHAESGIPSHSWAFCQALSHSGIDPKLALVRGGSARLVIPFFERRWRGETDICTILSVSGAAMHASDSGLLDAWAAFSSSRGWVAGYLQLEPESSIGGIAGAMPGNQVLLLDLTGRDPLANASSIIRRKIRRAEAQGARIIEDRAKLAAAVLRLYPLTMIRSGARRHYQFSDETLRRWTLDPDILAIGAAAGEDVDTVALFPVSGTRAEYHIAASSEAGRELSAWLIAQAIAKLKQLGVVSLNLGGGVSPGDGLHQFKKRFGGRELPLHAVRQIYRPDIYESLCRAAGASPDESWFPAYRAAEARREL